MSRCARVAAQAKVNLRLRVLAREASGYHGIETIFCRLDLADEVVVRVGPGIRGETLDCAGERGESVSLGPVERNLAMRAARAYAEATGWPGGFALELTKRIPVGGGLGGGSADAGAVLRALDALAPAPLGDRLVALAAGLGADVPFLTLAEPLALGWGRGGRLLVLAPLAPCAVALVIPPFAIATADAYAWLAAARDEAGADGRASPGAERSEVLGLHQLGAWPDIARIAVNDFESVVGAHHGAITRYLEGLRDAGAVLAMMSGSGACVFGLFASAAAAAAARDARAFADAAVLATATAGRVNDVEVSDVEVSDVEAGDVEAGDVEVSKG